MFCYNPESLENKTTNNFVNESYIFTQICYIVKTYMTTAREPSIYERPLKRVIKVKDEQDTLKNYFWPFFAFNRLQ